MTYTAHDEWEQHYSDGKNFRQLGGLERALLAEHTPVPHGGGRALEVGCGTGELAVYLAGLGYCVDAVDFAESAIARAREEHADVEGVRWLGLDIERDDLAPLHEGGYDLVVMRLMYPFLKDRGRVVHALGERLRRGGALVIITPVAQNTPEERRGIALDEDEIALVGVGWERVERLDADGLAFLVLRGPCHTGTRAVEKRPTTTHALTGGLAVVTDDAGRVLLGRSRRGMLELPGKTRGPEDFAAAAVRELAEETGLIADPAEAHVVSMLVDDSHGTPRLTAVVRITAWTGTLTNPEEDKFARWEFFDLHALACAGDVFVPAASALDAVWPGVIPDLQPVVSYPLAVDRPPVPGEPAEAVRLRRAMAQTVIDGGWAPSEPVQRALRTVPRHRFAPEVNLEAAYDGGDRAVVTRRDETGTAISSVSAAWLQADMIEHLRLEPGAVVFEAGSGGYNAELIAHVASAGRVVTVDIDPWVVRRTRAFLTEAGSGRVTAVEADAALGAPARLLPRGGFDAGMITYNCWDIAPAWREQLAEGGRLVLPLEMGGYTRAVTFERRGEVLHARHFTYCGFVRDQGQQARPAPVVPLLDGALTLRFDDGATADTDGLEKALRGPRHEVTTGVTMTGANSYFGSLQLYAATTLPDFCRLVAHQDPTEGVTGIAKDRDAPAIVGDASLAYLIHIQTKDGDRPEDKQWEWTVHAFGEQGPELAEQLAATVRAWDRHIRADDNDKHADPILTVHPAGTPDHLLPTGDVLDKASSRLVFTWRGRHGHLPAPARPTDTITATAGDA
ncbi:methyltransferase, FxLD system [Streptomyces sp. WZ.A104]|uniref:methyltransferase, FxLD system n=1 Tax=Streptomyces sp. WZ.A104 TaxID=2023771 RepID=UPI000BBBF484|nr:methyltransferase, FxLD system [Streptomyces sp. WZ.A104]PCG87203.1 methyltransferase, FxLD system [Streptomyces sp. WZ.A104]